MEAKCAVHTEVIRERRDRRSLQKVIENRRHILNMSSKKSFVSVSLSKQGRPKSRKTERAEQRKSEKKPLAQKSETPTEAQKGGKWQDFLNRHNVSKATGFQDKKN